MNLLCRLRDRVLRRLRSSESGFTLAELMVTVAINAIIVVTLASTFFVGAKSYTDVNGRLGESHDAQMLTTYLVGDAESTGYFSKTALPTGGTWDPKCSITDLNPVAIFAWQTGLVATKAKYSIYGTSKTDSSQLVRRFCEGTSTQPRSEMNVAKHVASVSTNVGCGMSACVSGTIPTHIAMTVQSTEGYNYTVRAFPRATDVPPVPNGNPVVTAVIRDVAVSTTPTKAGFVQWTVKFSEKVKNVSSSTLHIYDTVAGSPTITAVGGAASGSSVWTVRANVPSSSGSLRLDVTDPSDVIKDLNNNPLGGPGTYTYTDGEVFALDWLAPQATVTYPGSGMVNSTNWTGAITGGASDPVLDTDNVAGSGVKQVAVMLRRDGASPTYWNGTAFTTTVMSIPIITTGEWSMPVPFSAFTAGGSYTVQATATDNLGNVQGTATAVTFTVDAAPQVTIAKAGGQADPTNGQPVNFTATFDENVTGFSGAGVTVTGTAPGDKTALVTGGPAIYNVAVSGATGAGTIIVSVNAGAAKDSTGYDNSASPGSAQVSYDPSYVVPVLPAGYDIQGKPAGTGNRKPDNGDAVEYTFNQVMDPGSILSGWNGSSTNVKASFARAMGNDTILTIYNGANTTALNLGTVALDDYKFRNTTNDGPYIDSSGTTRHVLNATMVMETVSGDRSLVRITLTQTASGSPSAAGESGNQNTTLKWTPSSLAKNPAGVASGTAMVTQPGSAKLNF